ncbi:uncharacterized protein LOC125814567 [Solanum verrucosum]|uniref:uncharacterized protein LOC125814567 n=1 Tax=Solanum verrucosum TaxID=315347 RepID=UPI0020D149FA|nr:uncharacterized protein LOC125814567 [Solanum verrucosum]
MTSHDIQKDIVTACKIETVKAIIEDINSDYFALLVDESRDVSRKEKMAIFLRYIDKMRFVMEAFIGLVHIKDTSALSLKKAIVDLLAHHSLTLSNVRGQCYDGARNMQETGRRLNQEFGLVKAGDTRWGSHYKSFGNFISSFDYIVDVLDTLVENKKEQDIANAMIFVKVAKTRLQALRDNEWYPLFKKNIGWDSLKEKVEAFFIKNDISLPNFDDPYANSGRSRRKVVICNTLHHYRVDVFYKITDWQLQELNDRFNEVTSDFLNGVSCLNPIDSFSSFDIKKIMRMTELYPDDFDGSNMRALENQLVNYIIDVRDINERFSNLGGLGELSRKLVETNKHLTYSLVFLLVKFALLLPVATATVQKAFSVMKIIKNDLRN